MSKRIFNPAQDYAPVQISTEHRLPTDQPIAVYYRQSTDFQVGNVSTAIQTVDMVAYLEQRGWKPKDIYLIDMDAGVSGTKRIDERPGMKKLFELIISEKIKAIACQDEDRLFRDVTQIQVNIFIEACRSAGVLVITPSMVYDFAHPQMGAFHARQFRFKCEMAAEYLTSFVIGRLHRARMRLAMEGRWTGGSVPPGYMIDTRKVLPDGTRNENWRRYVPFEPYAEVINSYYRLFIDVGGGSVGKTLRYIYKNGLSYPDPNVCTPPEGFALHYGLRRHGSGYYPAMSALRHILTNAAYIGHWCVNDAVVRWNNHPAIVPTDTFFTALNFLSEQALDGTENTQYRPYRQYAQPVKDEERPQERPLLAGMMFSEVNGKWRAVGTEYVKREQHYRYLLYDREPVDGYIWSKNADWIDDCVSRLLQEKLRATFDEKIWSESFTAFEETYAKERKLKMAQLSALEQVMQNLIGGIETLTNPDMIRAVEKRYEDAKIEHARLSAELASADEQAGQLTLISQLKATYESAIDVWPQLTRDEKRVICQAFIDRIDATPIDKHGLQLTLNWRDGRSDKLSIPRLPTFGEAWSFEEQERLERLLESSVNQEVVAAAFPTRTWRVIRDRITRQRNLKAALFTPKPIRDFETYEDYQTRIDADPNSTAQARHQWRQEEKSDLIALLEQGASKMEIAQAFPYRTWTRLRSKISEVKGTAFEVAGDLAMSYKESYMQYQQRIGATEPMTSSISDSSEELDEASERDAPIPHHDRRYRAGRRSTSHSV